MSIQVTPLRQRMIEDMTICNMSPLTQKSYVRAVKNFSKYFRQSPDKLTFEDVRDYQLHLVSRGLGVQAINQILCDVSRIALLSHIPSSRGGGNDVDVILLSRIVFTCSSYLAGREWLRLRAEAR